MTENNKDVYIELHYSIPELIKLQENSIKILNKKGMSENVRHFQEDILTVLKAVEKIPITDLDAN